ncbi:MAG: Gfo/Idh/MocA family oxidoreductase [Planctomycetia bacterium]|nr:Gfo/Idh/MocA family oxidoreductase [Planctomycetia bacterium]
MKNTSRRDFLRTSLFAGAACAGGAVSPEVLIAANGVSANEKICLAIVGAGGRGGNHIQGFLKQPNVVITYVSDADNRTGESRCEQIAKKQNGTKPKFVLDMRDAFADKSVDIVAGATPNHWHALQAIWAMQAGKDVYVEKPASQNIAEGMAMVAAAKKYGRICQVGTQCRSNPAQRETVKFLEEGGIGDVRFARGLCYKRRKSIGALGDYPIPESVDFNFWSGAAPYTVPKLTRKNLHYDWHWQRLYGNGDSGNQGPHQFDIARWGLGLMRLPNSVITYGGRLGYQAERKDPNYVDAGDTANTEVSIFDFGDKTMVFETRGLETPDLDGAKIGVIFYGSEGKVVQDSYGHSTAYDKSGKVIREFVGGHDDFHYANFMEAVLKRDPSILNAPILDGHLSAALAHLGNISYYLGEKNRCSAAEIEKVLKDVPSRDDNAQTLARTVEHLKANDVDLAATPLSLGPMLKFDPEKVRFVDNEAANAMIGRSETRADFAVPKPENV